MMHLMPRARVRPLDIFRLPSGLFFAGVGGYGMDDREMRWFQHLGIFIALSSLVFSTFGEQSLSFNMARMCFYGSACRIFIHLARYSSCLL